MSTYDLAIMGGIVVDGTGLARRRGDIAVKDGRMAKIGFVDPEDADQVIDADGLHVAPGIVDAHTHYDPQLTFEPHATSSCYHGVTTVLAGNCGFSVAPNRPDQRDYLARMFAKVEGMSPVALSAVRMGLRERSPSSWPRRRRIARRQHGLLRRALGRAADGHGRGRIRARGDRRRGRADAPSRGRGHGGGGGGILVVARTDPARRRGQSRPQPLLVVGRARGPRAARRANTAAGPSATSTAAPSAGLDQDDKDLLERLGTLSRLPIILQGLGGRSKVDVPGAGWDAGRRSGSKRSATRGSGSSRSCATIPSTATSGSRRARTSTKACPSWHPVLGPGLSVAEKLALLAEPLRRDEMRHAVEHPNTDGSKGSTLPPPRWKVVEVDEVVKPENEKFVQAAPSPTSPTELGSRAGRRLPRPGRRRRSSRRSSAT